MGKIDKNAIKSVKHIINRVSPDFSKKKEKAQSFKTCNHGYSTTCTCIFNDEAHHT